MANVKTISAEIAGFFTARRQANAVFSIKSFTQSPQLPIAKLDDFPVLKTAGIRNDDLIPNVQSAHNFYRRHGANSETYLSANGTRSGFVQNEEVRL